MARRALQIIGNRPVILVAEPGLRQVGDLRRDAAQLRVTERIFEAGLRQKPAIGIAPAFRYADRAVTVLLYYLIDAREEFIGIEGDFRKQQDLRRITFFF